MHTLFRIGIIRVITLRDERALKAHGMVVERVLPGIKTVSRCIENQPKGIYDEESERIAIPKIIRLARELSSTVDGILVSCAGDPAVEHLSTILDKPVVGAGTPTALAALAYSDKVGVLGITDEPPKPFERILGNHMVAYEKPYGAYTTVDLGKLMPEIVEAGRRLVKAGARVIALACTGYTTIGAASILNKELNVPVVDPVLSGAITLYHMLITRYRLGEVLVRASY